MKDKRLTFGILIDWPDNNNKYQGSLIKGISSFAAKKDINLIVLGVGRLESKFSYEKPRELLYDYMTNSDLFSGFILFSSSLSSLSGTERLVEKIEGITELPVVSIAIDLPGIFSVLIDNRPGFEELIEHLIVHHKYRDIAFISGPVQSAEGLERLDTVRAVFARHSIPLPESHLYFGNFTADSGKEAISCFLDDRGIRPEAIIAANDSMAMGAWEVLKERHISVPGDIAITGFDDLQISPLFDLPFTTVKQPLFSQGYDVAEKLFEIISGEKPEQATVLKSQVVYRSSCGCLSETAGLPDSRNEEADKRTDEKTRFYQDTKEKLRRAVALEAEGAEGSPVIRCWNKIILSGLENDVRKSEMFSFIHTIATEYSEGSFSEQEKTLVQSLTERLKIMTGEFYLSSDLLGRLNEEVVNMQALSQIEGLGGDNSNPDSLREQLETLKNILPGTAMDICALSLFNSIEYSSAGHSTLMFSYAKGEVREVSNPVFVTNDLMHPEFIIEDRYEVLAELLFQYDKLYGILILDMNAKGINIFELLRTRLSRMIEAYYARQNLLDLNRQLKSEIHIRQETEQKLQKALLTLKDLSLSDELTGLYNRRGFMTLGEQQLRYCKREQELFTIFYADMDGLKKINDQYGHAEGDNAIQLVSEILKKSFRETDIISRLGGDEFTILAIKTSEDTVGDILERIRKNTAELNSSTGLPYKISFSMGMYYSKADEDTKLEEMMNIADRELYKKKRSRK